MDDESDQLLLVKLLLKRNDPALHVVSASSPDEALHMLESQVFSCIVSDYVMPGMNGIELARIVRETSTIPLILYTGQGSEEVASAAFAAGIDDYLRKEIDPAHYEVLARRIRTAVEKNRAELAEREHVKELSCLYGISRLVESGLDLEGIMEGVVALIPPAGQHPEETCARITLEGRSFETDNFRATPQCLSADIKVRDENVGAIEVYYLGERAESLGSPFLEDEGVLIKAVAERLGRITERKQTEEKLMESLQTSADIMREIPSGMIVYKYEPPDQLILLDGNQEVESLTDLVIDEVRGKEFDEIWHPKQDVGLKKAYLKVMETGEAFKSEDTHWSDEWIEGVFRIHAFRLPGSRLVVAFEDITERKRYEKRLEALHGSAVELERAGDVKEVAEATLNAADLALGFSIGAFGMVEGDMLRFIDVRGVNRWEAFELPLDGTGITVRAARTGETQLVPDTRRDPDHFVEPEKGTLQVLSELDVPVKVKDRVVAVLDAGSTELNAFTQEDRRLLETLAMHVASAFMRIRAGAERLRYEERLRTLHIHAVELKSAETVEEVFASTYEAMDSCLRFDRTDVIKVEDGFMIDVLRKGSPSETIRLPMTGKGITVRAARTGETQLVPDVRMDPDYVQLRHEARSELAVPVVVDGETVAVLNVESAELDAFTEEDRKLLETLAMTVASVLEMLREKEKERIYAERLGALHRYAAELGSAETVETIAERTFSAIEGVLGFDLGSFGVVEGGLLRHILVRGFDVEEAFEMPLDGRGVTVRAVRTGETQLVPDVREDEDFIVGLEGLYQSLSELAVPVKIGGTVVAVINVESTKLDTFTDGDQRLVEIFAEHVASALKSIRAAEERRRYEERLEALSRVMGSMNTAQSLGELVDQTLAIVEEVIVVPFSAYMLVEGDELITFRIRGAPLTGVRLSINGTGITARAAREKRTILVGDTRLDSDFVKGSTDSLSELDVPVVTNGEVVGVLNMESLELDYFDASHVSLAEALASHVSSNLERLKHFKEVQEMERTRAREAVESVAKIGSMVRHDLRGPLVAIGNAAYLLRGNPEDTKVLEIIDRSVSRAAEILEDLRERTWTGNLTPAPADLVGLIRETVEGLGAPEGVNVALKLHDGVVYGRVDGAKMRRVVENLVLNAFDAMPDGGELRVEEQVNDGCLVLRVSDTGVGIPSESLGKLFTPFFTTKKSGTGLGLVYCRQVVEAHGGTVSVESEAGRGTNFTVKLPLG